MAPEYQKQRGRCPLFRFRYVRLFAQVARMYGLCSQNVCPFKYIHVGKYYTRAGTAARFTA